MNAELRDGRYVLLKTLGEGSQGETFEAVDKREGRKVAVKRFRVGRAKAWKDVELAEREARTLASLDHARLPRYVEHFEEDGALVLVMELIEGRSVAALRQTGWSASVADVERLLSDASSALDYLHGRVPPVVHRDLKPANVIRRDDGSYAFVDFGSVRDRLKPAGGSTVVGTFGYMAPEQFQGRASPGSDVYGIGATALAMLTGEEPENLPHKGLAIDVARAVPSGTPAWLVRTLEAMLEPDPDRRAPSIAEALARGGRRPSDAGRKESRDRARAREAEERKARTERRRERKNARRARRAGRPPFVARFFARLGLLIAQIAVYIAVGIIAPVVLLVLASVFGPSLRHAAAACRRAAGRASRAIGRAGDRLDGANDVREEEPRVRVADDPLRRVRAVSPEEAQQEAIRAAERRGEDAEAWARERADEEVERWQWEERVAEAEDAGGRKKRNKIPR